MPAGRGILSHEDIEAQVSYIRLLSEQVDQTRQQEARLKNVWRLTVNTPVPPRELEAVQASRVIQAVRVEYGTGRA